jgi:hypothetical protein
MKAKQFLLVYDRRTGDVKVRDLGDDAVSALREYERLENEFRPLSSIEVVLIGSDSIETVQRTHPHYFSNKLGESSADRLSRHVAEEA